MDRASLADKPSYNALSYTWGAPNFTQSICINGRCFRVTKNLQSALFHLRQQHESVVVWIDAVCINQKDNEEKSHQVQQMQRIYEEAQLVLIWLGPARDESDVAMDNDKEDEEDDGLTLEQILSQVTNKHGTQAALPTGAIYHLLQRPWWQRVWVVQELGAARKAIFMCGSRSIDANRMSTALTIFR
ncbi:HET-domain-containing protein, partial [Trematosphaeria pertusa]